MSFIKSMFESLLKQSSNGSNVATGAEQQLGLQSMPTQAISASPVQFKSGPRVLLIDANDTVVERLKKGRFPVHAGSFGPIVITKRSAQYMPVKEQSSITEHQEQDIVVVNLLVDPLENDPTVHDVSPEVSQLWAPCENGLIDYRPLAMLRIQDDFDRILAVGGVIIVFAQRRIVSTYHMGHCKFNDLRFTDAPFKIDNYAFLSILRDLVLHADRGRACTSLLDGTEYASSPLGKFIRRHLEGFSFQCTIGAQSSAWLPLVGNKYGATVAGALLPIEGLDRDVVGDSRKGWVFVFPEVVDQAGFLADFITTVLPLCAPELFPEEDGEHWIHRPEYEEPRVINIMNEIKSIEEETRAKIESLRLEIERAQDSNVPMYNLLRAQGDELVGAVKYCLAQAGFEHIIDSDEEIRATGTKNAPLNEDLRVEDAGPLLLIEIKGIHGHVPDAEALQVWKYIAPRMKLLKRTDIQGLAIVNHQRGLPPLERDNVNTFRPEIVENAIEHEFGLMTTWDLFRLMRSVRRNGWRPEDVKPIFYRSGRVTILPEHYQLLGTVEHYYPQPNVISVRITHGELRVGDRIGYEGAVEIWEAEVISMQVKKAGVSIASAGPGNVGIKLSNGQNVPKVGALIYRVVQQKS